MILMLKIYWISSSQASATFSVSSGAEVGVTKALSSKAAVAVLPGTFAMMFFFRGIYDSMTMVFNRTWWWIDIDR